MIGLFYPFSKASVRVEEYELVDGDTFLIGSSGKRKVRLKGIDAPETSGYNQPQEFKGLDEEDWRCLEKWGYRAEEFLGKRLEGSVLEYRKGVLTFDRGKYGRLLGKVYINGSRSLGELMVERGLARSYSSTYRTQEKQARNLSRGLWKCGG